MVGAAGKVCAGSCALADRCPLRRYRSSYTHPHLPPPPPKPQSLIGLPDPVTVFGREVEVADIRARLCAAPSITWRLSIRGRCWRGKGDRQDHAGAHYITTYQSDYDAVLWTLSASRQDVFDGQCAACPALGLETTAQPQLHHAQQVVSAIAASGRPWLIVFDNLEDRRDLEGLVPMGAHVLVTTRQSRAGRGGTWCQPMCWITPRPTAPPCGC